MAEIKVNNWCGEYVRQLFINRGYDPVGDEKVADLIANQWEHWKRLLVKSGLNADRGLADEVAFGFAIKVVKGGPGRLLEAFAEFVLGRPQEVREAEQKQASEDHEDCEICERLGLVRFERVWVNSDGVEQVSGRSYRCRCRNSKKYPALPIATPQMLQEAINTVRRERDSAYNWCRINLIDPDATAEERAKQWRRWFVRNFGTVATSSKK